VSLNYTIIIPNYNGKKFLGPCLDTIAAQTLQPLETIVVDDASSDDSKGYVSQNYPWVKIIRRERNGGFTAACNSGIDAAQGDVIVLFNNDAEADPRWLGEIDRVFREHPEIDMVASKIMLHDRPNVFHAAGDYYQRNGVPGNRGVWQEDRGQYNKIEEVFGPCGAAAAYRRSALEETRVDNPDGKVLDESLFMYLEDVDLNLRLHLRGKTCLYAPGAQVRHHLSATGGGTRAAYQCGRNFLLVAVKNLPGKLLWKCLPFIIFSQLGYAIKSLRLIRLDTERARLKGQWHALKALPHTLRQRKQVQIACRVSQSYFEKLLELNQS
jgi:GT2 family glycosyltransferase